MTPLIVALDFDDQSIARALVDQLNPAMCALKIGSEMFTRFGPQWVRDLVNLNFDVFLDLKFHDIPTTVARACQAGADLGVWMMNVHASGGLAMMQSARNALENYGHDRPLLIAVTVLTSMDQYTLSQLGVTRPLTKHILDYAQLAQEAGLDGVVCSAQETPLIKAHCGSSFLTVTPGIRIDSNNHDDQTRVMSPQDALNNGSDFLVVGRPITRSTNPMEVVHAILRHE